MGGYRSPYFQVVSSAPLEPKVLDVSFAQKTVICLTRLASLSGDTDQDVLTQYSGDHVTVLKVDKLAKVI